MEERPAAYPLGVPDAPLEEFPRFIVPMLASAGPAPTEAGSALEVKWDSMRAQLRYDGRRVCVRTRRGRDCTAEFLELAAIGEALAGCRAHRAIDRPERRRGRAKARTGGGVTAVGRAESCSASVTSILGASPTPLPLRG